MATEVQGEKKSENGGGTGSVGEEAKDGGNEVKNEEVEEKKEEEKSKESAKEVVTPKERPTRERKAVERYAIASPYSRSSAGKPLSIVKGTGTLLKDIPNVAFKLSKRKPDDNLQLLHTILFGKRAKAHNLKKDIGQFSGFIWVENEEKQRAKTKEKLDKCVKEKLLDFCDVLNIPISRASVRKEDLSAKLLEFLESPHATTEMLLADKNQKTKKQKRKATPANRRSSEGVSMEKPAKKTKAGEKQKRPLKADEENETDDKDENLDSQSHSSEEDDDAIQKQETDYEEISSEEQEDDTKERRTSPKNKSKDENEVRKKSTKIKKSSSEKSTMSKSPAKSAKKIEITPEKSTADAKASASTSKAKGSLSRKRKVDEEKQQEKPIHEEEKSTSKKQASKSTAKEQGKGKTSEKAKSEPTTEELRAEAENILKEVDFNTATLSDILRLLGSHFDLDLMHRKGEVKAIITEVIENMSNDGDDDDDEDEDEDDDNDDDGDDSGKE